VALVLRPRYLARVRTPLAVALVIAAAACGRGERSNVESARAVTAATPAQHRSDSFVLRVPRSGGTARVTPLDALDSTVWTSGDAVPALERILAFDDDAGLVAFVDSRGFPGRIDFRLGTVVTAYKKTLRSLASYDASAIFGVGSDGAVVRLAPEGDWLFKPPTPARAVFPQANGTILVLADGKDKARLWRIHPPDTTEQNFTELPSVTRAVSTKLADRVFVVTGEDALIGVRTRTLTADKPLKFGDPVVALAATPSGDRAYVAVGSEDGLRVVDPYQNKVTGKLSLPGRATELRMDPLGRYLLARPSSGDSAWVIAIGNNELLGSVPGVWRGDLPLVAANGSIAVVHGADVRFVDPTSFKVVQTVAGGAGDFWWPFTWNGFAPRAAGLDQPVHFPGDSTDSVTAAQTAQADSARDAAAPPSDTATAPGFVVSFAALLDQEKARTAATGITVEGQTARVVPTAANGTTVYRVILGPYATREQANRIGRESGKSYWVFQGAP